jgi:hypothetical protein
MLLLLQFFLHFLVQFCLFLNKVSLAMEDFETRLAEIDLTGAAE